MDPAGKVALITGSGLGIGRGVAAVLAGAGAAVVVNDISEDAGRETVRRIEAGGGKAGFVLADITDQADVQRMIAFAETTFGGLDILVNNAGAGEPPGFPVAHPTRWNAVLDVYLRATMTCTQEAIKSFDRRGGVVVNISSLAGVGYRPYWWPEYAAAKAAVIRLTAALGSLAETKRVRVNCVCPNWVATEKVIPTVAAMSAKQRKEQYVPDELATPEDIGEVVLEFVRDETMAGRIIHHFAHGEQRLLPLEEGDV